MQKATWRPDEKLHDVDKQKVTLLTATKVTKVKCEHDCDLHHNDSLKKNHTALHITSPQNYGVDPSLMSGTGQSITPIKQKNKGINLFAFFF